MFGMVLAFGLMSLIKLLFQRYENSAIIAGLKNMGKLSLTMYILQSIIGTSIFYGYGLGLFGADIFIWSILIVIVIYLGQMYMSTLYLKHFRYGPLEYFLRIVTYMNVRKKKWVKSEREK